jgi:hypothetical protein
LEVSDAEEIDPGRWATMEGHSHAIDGRYPMWRSLKPGAQARPLACDGSRPLQARPGLDGWNWVRSGKKPAVSELLRKFGLDERSIEAPAFRSRADELESLDRMLALAEGRRDKALRCVADPSAWPEATRRAPAPPRRAKPLRNPGERTQRPRPSFLSQGA